MNDERFFFLFENVFRVLQLIIILIATSFIVFQISKAVNSIALSLSGKETLTDIFIATDFKITLSVAISIVFGISGTIYGCIERQAKKKKVPTATLR